MIKVFLSVSNRQVFRLVDHVDIFLITEECKEWLNTLYGSYFTEWESNESGCVFKFYDDNEAILFKLVWG